MQNHNKHNNENEFSSAYDKPDWTDRPKREPAPKADNFVNTDTSSINKKVEEPIIQETDRLQDIAESNRKIDAMYQEKINKDWSLWDRLKNRDMYSTVQDVRNELLQKSSNYRLKFYTTILDARLSGLSERCDAGVKMIKGHYRKEVSSFLMAKIEDLSQEIKKRQMNFLEMMKEKHDHADSLDDYPTLQIKYRETIFNEEERFLQFLEKLILRFQAIADEELDKYT